MRPIQPYTKYPYKYLTAVHVVFPIFSLGTLQTLVYVIIIYIVSITRILLLTTKLYVM